MVGVDFNDESLEVTNANLMKHSVPHVSFFADIGQPSRLETDLRQHGFDPANVLHVRTFLDHDRPFTPPVEATTAYDAYDEGVYVSPDGYLIQPSIMLQSLKEHLSRWRSILAPQHGIALLEAGQLPPHIAGKYFASCTSRTTAGMHKCKI
ncbi:methyltransferase [Pycnococcus provasolii]